MLCHAQFPLMSLTWGIYILLIGVEFEKHPLHYAYGGWGTLFSVGCLEKVIHDIPDIQKTPNTMR